MKTVFKRTVIGILCFAILLGTALPSAAKAAGPEWADPTEAGYAEAVSEKYLNFMTSSSFEYLWDDLNFSSEIMYNEIVNNTAAYSAVLGGLMVLDEELERDDCVRILATIIQMQENGFSDSYQDLAKYDALKTADDYALDVASILTGLLAFDAYNDEILSRITDVLGSSNELAELNITSLEQYQALLTVLRGYEQHTAFLLAVRDNTEIIEEMREAADAMLDVMFESSMLRLESFEDMKIDFPSTSYNLHEQANDIFSDALLDRLENSDTYVSKSTLRSLTDWVETQKDGIMWSGGVAKTLFKLDIFAGDMLFGTTDIYRRFTEIEALHWVTNAVQKEIDSVDRTTSDPQANLEAAQKTVPLLQYLILLRARSEYCIQQLVYYDAQIYSVIETTFGDTDQAIEYYNSLENFLGNAWEEVSSILEYEEWPDLESLSSGESADALLEDKLSELVSQYGVIATGTELYSGTGYGGGETVVPASRITGLLCADIYDYDGDGQNELLVVRAEPVESYETGPGSGGFTETTLCLSMYDLAGDSENPSAELADEKTLLLMGLPDTLYSSSIQFMRGTDDDGAALYLDYYQSMNTQTFGMIRLTYDGTLHISGGVDCSEFNAAVFCDTDATEGALETMGGRQTGLGSNRSGWKQSGEYDWEGKAAEIPADDFDSYRKDWETALKAIDIEDSFFRTSYDYAIPVIHDTINARKQYFTDLCTRRPADTCTMTNGGTLTELCGILSPYQSLSSGENRVEFTCYDSIGLLDPYRGLTAEEDFNTGAGNDGSASADASSSSDSSMDIQASGITTSDKLFYEFTTAFLQQDSHAIAALYGLESEEGRASLETLWAQRLTEVEFGNYSGIQTVSSAGTEILSAEEAASLCSAYAAPPDSACLMIVTASPDWSQVWPDWIAGGIELYAAEYDGNWYLVPKDLF